MGADGETRDETDAERLDRNWNDILQELRVMQTGTQLIAGFLLTLPFTSRFPDLDAFEEDLYLALVLLAGLTLALLLTPVAIHRRLFGEHVKGRLVTAAHRLMVAALAAVALLITGNVTLIFHVVVGATAAYVVGGLVLVVVTGLLLVVPVLMLPRRET
jgi:hypothetical protein